MSHDRPTRQEKLGMRLEIALSGVLFRQYLRGLDLGGDERLLEIGCGVGALTKPLVRFLPRGRITAVDLSPHWSEVARRRLKRRKRVTVLTGDVRALDLEPESFDAVLLHFVLHDIPAPERHDVLKALARLLVPGGTLYLREPTRPSHGMPADEIRELFAAAGFEEVRGADTRSRVAGPMFDARFRKVQPSGLHRKLT